jgi:hypothetical protein
MKKIIFSICVVYFLCGASSNHHKILTDYRDVYCGNYFCKRTRQYLNSEHSSIVYANDTITIAITKDAVDSILNIAANQVTYKTKLISGKLSTYISWRQCSGKFYSSDSITFVTSGSQIPNSYYFRGKKK